VIKRWVFCINIDIEGEYFIFACLLFSHLIVKYQNHACCEAENLLAGVIFVSDRGE